SLKVTLTYEDFASGFAFVEYFESFHHQVMSNNGIGFTDSIVVLGNDSVDFYGIMAQGSQLTNKMKISVYDPNDSINTYREMVFVVVTCPTTASSPIIINPTGSYCSNDSVFLSAASNYSNYQWSTGDTVQTIYVPANMPVYIDATDSLGCISKDTSNIDVSIPYEEQICIVSVDSITGKNIIVWEKTALVNTDQFYIYKESFQANVYNLIGFVDYDSLSVFIDVNSNPLQQAERYKISTIDSCGAESTKSSDHKTIHLTASVGTNNENNLVWDGYTGFTFPTYNIYRGPSPNNMTLLAQVASTAFTYSDLTPLSSNNYYKVEAVRNTTCSPTQKATSYPSSISNQVVLNPLGVKDFNTDNVQIYPNPVEDILTINLGGISTAATVNVKNILGATVKTEMFTSNNQFQLNLDIEAGVYFVEIFVDGNHFATKRIVRK
ncbi:MAG: T9SS type A sorting domain-containing protein, partial [Vicingaceae bacterium]|nr:T9SS type A sorting domain-containing protein [Vicingaceae bacterium]